ncbi:MAG: DUF2007 domain-containing protein [Acidobacteriota bacterium]
MSDATGKKAERDMELKEVCRVMGPVEAEVVKSFLESNGITCATRGTWVQSVSPIAVDGLGEIKILVLEKDYPVAKELLKDRALIERE